MNKHCKLLFLIIPITVIHISSCTKPSPRQTFDFNQNWQFFLGDDSLASQVDYEDSIWRTLSLPHDWSIEGDFDASHPATIAGGALPTGIAWYRKSFRLSEKNALKQIYIEFDGIYRNSEMWINGHYLGKRPNGYISFRYDLTPYIKFGEAENVISIRVDNSLQPNSRWYTGSGIYRNVRLVFTEKIAMDHWGIYITTPMINDSKALIHAEYTIKKDISNAEKISVRTIIINQEGKKVYSEVLEDISLSASFTEVKQEMELKNPVLWSVDNPYLYKAVTEISSGKKHWDRYETTFGIRYFNFHAQNGFSLNGKPLKILGVNDHHDLGALGAAVNVRAMERKLEIYKAMGCNAIRTAHNPPAPELLDLCDKIGFLVINEAFDEWKRTKVPQGYHIDWDGWHKKDLEDFILRDRNHPSIIIWSIGNEIPEQFDSSGTNIAKELVEIVKSIDTSRPVTCALTENIPDKNFIYQSKSLDLLSFNYKHEAYKNFPDVFPGEKMIASENMSALATRGFYQLPSDSMHILPPAYNASFDTIPGKLVSAYDHSYAYWGSTHEESWAVIKKYNYIPGVFIWSGFDYLGEPIPHGWPARSSYYGVFDLAGFAKDAYYMYQSEWTTNPVVHIFPHWNWAKGDTVDVWAYYNQADEVELYLNDKSLGSKSKGKDTFHVRWRVPYMAGTLKAVSHKNGQVVMEKEIHTAGKPAKIQMLPDREFIHADAKDLSFVTVKILDKDDNFVPIAENLITFEIQGEGTIVATDNGYQADLTSFKSHQRKAFNGLCLVIVRAGSRSGKIVLTARAENIESCSVTIKTK